MSAQNRQKSTLMSYRTYVRFLKCVFRDPSRKVRDDLGFFPNCYIVTLKIIPYRKHNNIFSYFHGKEMIFCRTNSVFFLFTACIIKY